LLATQKAAWWLILYSSVQVSDTTVDAICSEAG